MGLAFAGAGSDGRPRDEIGYVLGSNGIEKLGCGGKPYGEDFGQKLAGDLEAGGNVIGSIEIGIHDEALPTYGRTGFFEVDPHHDENLVFHFIGELGQFLSIFATGLGVMDRAGADDQEEAGIGNKEGFADVLTGFQNEIGLFGGALNLRHEDGRGGERGVLENVDV